MNEFSSHIFDQLDAYTPESSRWPDWRDVLLRTRRRRTRRIAVALAATLAVLGSAAAVTAALGGFDSWLSGEPGKPAPRAEQQRFEESNTRSLAAFPKDTKLRQLISTTVDGKRYVLFGFRSGRLLCLRLKAVSLGHSAGPTCAPVSKVVHSPVPIVAVVGNWGFQDRHARTSATVSFGIAADGVSRIDVRAVDGIHRAVLGGNAYLWVENEPDTGNRVLSVTAVDARGSRVTLPISTSFGMFGLDAAPERPLRGPARVQIRIKNPRVGWFIRGERRGFSLEEVRKGFRTGRKVPDTYPGTRWIKPDPRSNVLVGLTGHWCLLVFQSGGQSAGCSPGREFWARGPLNLILSSEGDEFVRMNGVAADGVRRVVVFLAGGETQQASLRDNLFTTLVSKAEFPARVVAYDGRGRVVGVQTWRWNLGAKVPARAARPLRRVLSVRGPKGTTAVARVGRQVRGYRCWRVDFSGGPSRDGCLPPIGSGPSIWIDLVQPAGADLFVIGHALWPVAEVQLEFPDESKVRTRVRSGLFLLAIPRNELRTERQVAFVHGYTSEGLRLSGRQPVVFKVRR